MAAHTHHYKVVVEWTGNRGSGTSGYKDFDRTHEISVPGGGKPVIPGSADRAFRGDAARWNPEDLLVASIAACHKLWYLHLCADAGIVVTGYRDEASGEMRQEPDGAGRFTDVTLRPAVRLAPGSDAEKARALHNDAHRMCFIANSLNFPVRCEPDVSVEA